MKISALSLLLGLATLAHPSRGQTVSYEPNKLGLDVESVSVSAQNKTVQVAFRNNSGKAITAYAVSVASGYSDGERLNYDPSIDFFVGIGLEQYTSPDQSAGALQPGAARTSSFLYPQAGDPGATLTSVRVSVTSIIFSDESTAGQSEPLRPIFSRRDAESAELLRWCADIDQISGKPIAKKTFDDFVGAHMAGDPQELRSPLPQNSITALTRKGFASLLQQGLQWKGDGTGLLLPAIAGVLNAKCDAAREHISRKEAK